MAEHSRLLCAQPSSVPSHLQYLPITAHSALCFHGQVLPSKQVQSLGEPPCKQQNKVSKTGQMPPEQKHWVRAISPSPVPCTSPQHTSPSTHAQLLATLLSLLPTDSSTVTQATAELPGSQAVCPRQMPTCHYLETPESFSISSQVPPPQQVLMHFCLFLVFNCSHGVLGSGWQPPGSVLSAHLSAQQHHGATVSSDRSPQHAAPELSVRTLRGWKNYREAQKHMRTLEMREGVWMRTDRAFEKRPSAFNHRAASPEGALAALPRNMPRNASPWGREHWFLFHNQLCYSADTLFSRGYQKISSFAHPTPFNQDYANPDANFRCFSPHRVLCRSGRPCEPQCSPTEDELHMPEAHLGSTLSACWAHLTVWGLS